LEMKVAIGRFVVSLFIIGEAAQVMGDTIEYSATASYTPADSVTRHIVAGDLIAGEAASSGLAFTLTVPKFDSAYGNLISVDFNITNGGVLSLECDNFSNQGVGTTASASIVASSPYFTGGQLQHTPSYGPAACGGNMDDFDAITLIPYTDHLSFLGTDVSPFVGSVGTVPVDFSVGALVTASNAVGSDPSTLLGPGEEIYQTASINLDSGVAVTYGFTPTPEPSSAVTLLGVGAIGLAGYSLQRRWKRRGAEKWKRCQEPFSGRNDENNGS
jgi:hypothetical protein